MNIERLAKSQVKVTLECSAEEFQAGLDHAFEIANGKVTIKGFRQGKAPKSKYLQQYGVESLYNDAIEYCVQQKMEEHIFNHKDFTIVSQPRLDLDFNALGEGKGFTFTLVFDVMPEVLLGQYKGIEVEKHDATVTDEEIKAEETRLLKDSISVVTKEIGTLENGNSAIFDFVGSVDGVEFPGGSAENFELKIGSGQFIPGFEEQMVGMKVEEVKDIVVTFPEAYHEANLAGKEAVFKVTLHEIKEEIMPELTDEVVAELKIEQVATIADFRAHVIQTLQERKEKAEKDRIENEILGKVVEGTTVDIPQSYIHDQKDAIRKNVENQAKQYQIPFEMFLQFSGVTPEQFETQITTEAEQRVKFDLIIGEIIKTEKLEASEEEIETQIADLTVRYQLSKEELLKRIDQRNIVYNILHEKAVKLILTSAIVK